MCKHSAPGLSPGYRSPVRVRCIVIGLGFKTEIRVTGMIRVRQMGVCSGGNDLHVPLFHYYSIISVVGKGFIQQTTSNKPISRYTSY